MQTKDIVSQLGPAQAKKIETAVAESRLSDILDQVDWSSAAIETGIWAIDACQKFILPALVKASPQVGGLLAFALQAVEDNLRSRQPKSTDQPKK